VVLNERIHHCALGGELGDHVKRFVDNDLSVQDVVVGIVAVVDHIRKFDHEACRVALAVGAGIGFVGGEAVVGEKFILALAVDDDASARTLHFGGDVNPAADEVNLLILKCIRVNREGERRCWPIGVFRIFLTALQARQKRY